MKKTVSTIVLCCLFFSSWSQFDNKLSELKLKGKVSSIVEKEYQLTNYDYDSKKEERKAIFMFNSEGYKLEEKYMSPSDEVLYLGVFTYSSSGVLVAEKVNNFEFEKNFVKQYINSPKEIIVNIAVEAETPHLYEKYTLDAKKNVTQKVEYDDRGEAVRTFKYTYNPAGKIQSETQQVTGASINFKYTYNNKGQLSKKTEVDALGKIIHTQTYTYDKNGYVDAEITSYTDDSQKLTLKYKYVLDSMGNWIEKQEFMDEHLFSVITREISYY
jgi:hypothetical protein